MEASGGVSRRLRWCGGATSSTSVDFIYKNADVRRSIYARTTNHFYCNLGSFLPIVLIVGDQLKMDDSTENDGLDGKHVCLLLPPLPHSSSYLSLSQPFPSTTTTFLGEVHLPYPHPAWARVTFWIPATQACQKLLPTLMPTHPPFLPSPQSPKSSRTSSGRRPPPQSPRSPPLQPLPM